MEQTEVQERVEVIFAVEGHERHFSAHVDSRMTVLQFAAIAKKVSGIDETVEIFVEDAELPLEDHLILTEHLSVRFAPIHVARPGLIKVTVEYNNKHAEHDFRPSASVGRIIEWAIGKHGLRLEGSPADYQLKFEGKVLSPDQHLGQVAHGKKTAKFDLVFKIKPQG